MFIIFNIGLLQKIIQSIEELFSLTSQEIFNKVIPWKLQGEEPLEIFNDPLGKSEKLTKPLENQGLDLPWKSFSIPLYGLKMEYPI